MIDQRGRRRCVNVDAMPCDRVDIVGASLRYRPHPGASEQFGVLDVEPHRHLRRASELCRVRRQLAGLHHVARKPIEHVATTGQCCLERCAQDLEHQLVRDEVTSREVISHPASELGARGDLRPQELARRQVGDVEVRGDTTALGSFPGRRGADQQHAHGGALRRLFVGN